METIELERSIEQQHCTNIAIQKVTEVCNEKNLRLTDIRKRVLELVWQAQGPVGAYTILGQLIEDGRNAAPTTVYRALDFLLDEGFVHRLSSLNAFIGCAFPGHITLSQFLICNQCSKVDELQSFEISQSIDMSAKERQFQIKNEIIEIQGSCKACRKD